MTRSVRPGRVPPMTLDEATAIAEHARDGRLDLGDPRIRRTVEEANRMLVRSELAGATARDRQPVRRGVVIGVALLALGCWLAGMAAAVLVSAGG